MKIFVITGLIASGKSTHVRDFIKKYDFQYFETGESVLEEVNKQGGNFEPENIERIIRECKKISNTYFTDRIIEKITKDTFIVGIRAPDEVKVLKKAFGEDNVITIAFHASLETRFQRIHQRKNFNDKKSTEDEILKDYDKFIKRNQVELSWGLGNVIVLSDYIINTEDKIYPYNNYKKSYKEFLKLISKYD